MIGLSRRQSNNNQEGVSRRGQVPDNAFDEKTNGTPSDFLKVPW